MKGTNDTQILLGIIIFLASLGFISSAFGTEVTRMNEGFNSTYVEGNITTIQGGGGIPAPPICTSITGDTIPFIGGLIDAVGCMVGYSVWLVSLMFVTSDVQWLYILILLPCIVAIGFIVVRMIKPTGGAG